MSQSAQTNAPLHYCLM